MKIIKLLFVSFLMMNISLPQSSYDNHVFFDNSLTDTAYYYSAGEVIKPGELETIRGKIPVENKISFTPPNCLKLKWISRTGGDWYMKINADRWRGRDISFTGDTLKMKLFSYKEIPGEVLPSISIQNLTGASTQPLRLNKVVKFIPANEWTTINIPFDKFGNSTKPIDLKKIKSITFSQSIDDNEAHTLFIDEILVYNETSPEETRSATVWDSGKKEEPKIPSGLKAKGYARHVDLSWNAEINKDILGIAIYRSLDGINFKKIALQNPGYNRFSDFLGKEDDTAFYKISEVKYDGKESGFSEVVKAATSKMSDEELLSMVQEACFRYFWEGAHPVAGLALESIPGDKNLVATGASGFGIMAMLVGIERGFITRAQGVERMLKIVKFLEKADRFHGVFPHFMDGRTGKVIPLFGKYDDGGDLVETSFLMEGLLAARQYFNRNVDSEKEIFSIITKLWEDVDWNWYRGDKQGNFLYWHWSPDYGWKISHPLVGWNETMIAYLLAISSPTHPVPASLYYNGWASQSDTAVEYRQNWSKTMQGDHYSNGNSYYRIKLNAGEGTGGPLFFTHYSFMGFDPHALTDKYTNYFENNRNIALINHAYCEDNPGGFVGYSDSCWGLTASDDPWGYDAHDPSLKKDNGTITPTGALASFPYTPVESMKALKYFYYNLGDKLWGNYGFRDAFNLTQNWYANIFMGLDQSPIVVMIENYRTGLIWKLFMSNKEIQQMLSKLKAYHN
ncbi:MAG: glucoamylase family protein [Ignavibacteriaceae bacterium]